MTQGQKGDLDLSRVEFAADINPMLAESFLEEAPLHAARFAQVVERLFGDEPSVADVVHAQRLAHSLKGSAIITGVSTIATITHEVEDILDWVAESGELPPAELRDTMLETADCVSSLVDALRAGGPAPASTERVFEHLKAWREAHLKKRPADGEGGAADAASTVPRSDLAMPGAAVARRDKPPSQPESKPVTRSQTAALRVPVGLVDRLLRLAGEFAISNVQSQGAQQRMIGRANTLREQHHLVQQRLLDLQDLVQIRGVPSRHRFGDGSATVTGTLVQGFDPLELDEYNELHSKTTALAEAVTDFCEVALGLRQELARMDDTIADQQRISKDFSDSVLSARMVSVGTIEQRLQRVVRETCRATGKQASLELLGGEIPVDGDVLNTLVDPLLHLLRNAVDHGIEEPAAREAAGKASVGSVSVAFARAGENVLVTVRDDGRGFDLERIREVARRRGLLAADEFRSDRELLQLAVSSGFSTSRETTQLSGRGIGMGVAHEAVLGLKGSMDIATAPGGGSTVTLRVPLTLISMHVLLVRVGGQVFGVPSGTLRQVLFSDSGVYRGDGEDRVFTHEERDHQVISLGDLLGRPREPAGARTEPLLLLDADSGPMAVVVDAAVDGRYLVVNSLGERVPRPAGVVGASILGDGSVAPVLDLREMMRHRPSLAALAERAGEATQELSDVLSPEVLIVEDSLTARRMLSIAMSEAGYRVRTAIDGLDAIEAIEEVRPDLVITDLEMPRMNGLELTAHLRADASLQELPILMVTSRSTEKHRGQAVAAGINDFITKPYSKDDLLETVARLLEPASVTV